MKYIIYTLLIVLVLTSCDYFPNNYHPDPDDAGLSQFTSSGYNIVTNYINGTPYINVNTGGYYNYSGGGYYNGGLPLLKKIVTASPYDTLSLSWKIQVNNSSAQSFGYPIYEAIAILIPVAKSFNANSFLALNGQRLATDSCNVALTQYNSFNGSDSTVLTGMANIYFVKISLENAVQTSSTLYFSGLFNGNVGDSVAVTKGRFDFAIPTSGINF